MKSRLEGEREGIQVLMNELVARKQKWEGVEKAKSRWSLFLLGCLALLVFAVYRLFIESGAASSTRLISVLTTDPFFIGAAGLCAIGYWQLRFFSKKEDKAEKEYEELRLDIIARSPELWEDDRSWKKREQTYAFMKRVHGVNLYHK
ncbi:YpbF family protein [Alkalihalobacillus oceani]|uniref:YpbF family protein n=1 Tax=Halalkalibacter oceani TaxID=1653776 RepID=A0A9X2DR78_9BACI|nr:DUF2663 family protein [Halalkalibacter oceani]MCM3713638.1 YpbF family protein [Halalkalibacter oceani]